MNRSYRLAEQVRQIAGKPFVKLCKCTDILKEGSSGGTWKAVVHLGKCLPAERPQHCVPSSRNGKMRGDKKALGSVGISPFFFSGFCSLSFEKLFENFAQIFCLSRVLLYVPIILASGGGAMGEVGRRIQVSGQPGQVREPLSQDKSMENKNQVFIHGREFARHV